jgi:plastocyanin
MLAFNGTGRDNDHGRGGKFLKAIRKFALRRLAAGIGLVLAVGLGTAQAGTLQVRVLADGKPVDDAVVYAVPVGSAPPPVKPNTTETMVQENKQFSKFVLPIQVGTTVAFPNRDPFRHHVYSFSPAKSFELKLYAAGEVHKVTFDKEGVVALGCNIHDNMLAYIYVVGTPYFAKTENGAGSIDLPAGDYAVHVWHPSQRAGASQSQNAAVSAAGTTQLELNVDLKRGPRQRPPGAVDEKAY